MALKIITIASGVYRVGCSDVARRSGVRIIPVKLLQDYFPGGPSSFVKQSGLSRHITEVDGFLFVTSGSSRYRVSDYSSLVAAQFVLGRDFISIQVGDSASGWYRGTTITENGGLHITLDPSSVEPSEYLKNNSEAGRLCAIPSIVGSAISAERKFEQLAALLGKAAPGT